MGWHEALLVVIATMLWVGAVSSALRNGRTGWAAFVVLVPPAAFLYWVARPEARVGGTSRGRERL